MLRCRSYAARAARLRALGFTERAIEQLGDQDKQLAQRILANTPSITVHQTVLGAVATAMEAARVVRYTTEWGTGPSTTSAFISRFSIVYALSPAV